jgi:hypothetical protein
MLAGSGGVERTTCGIFPAGVDVSGQGLKGAVVFAFGARGAIEDVLEFADCRGWHFFESGCS